MRVGVISDVHVHNARRFGGPEVASINQRCRITLDVLYRAITKAEQEQCEALLVLGDLFDSDHPEPQVIAEVQQRFREAQAGGMKIVCLLGNHESTSTQYGDHALNVLADAACIVADRYTVLQFGDTVVLLIPYQPGDAAQYIRTVLQMMQIASKPGEKLVLALHCGLRDCETAPWLKTAQNSVDVQQLVALCRQYAVSQVIAGDWHSRHEWSTDPKDGLPFVHVLQVGALSPTGFSDAGLEGFGTLAVIDASLGPPTIHEIAGPRFLKWRGLSAGLDHYREDIEMRLNIVPRLTQARYVSWTVPAKDLAVAQERLALLKHLGLIVDGEVLADEAEQEIAARTSAQAAASADTLDEAISGWVASMQLDVLVDRAEVERRVRGYLGGSRAE